MKELPPKLLALAERDRIVWNEAIEAAAKLIDEYKTYEADFAAFRIRKLKK